MVPLMSNLTYCVKKQGLLFIVGNYIEEYSRKSQILLIKVLPRFN